MAMPSAERGETGEGPVPALVPRREWVIGVKANPPRLTLREYRAAYLEALVWPSLAPGRLEALREGVRTPVRDGDTLVCCCARDAAGRGECHRAWAAYALYASGWDVVLDGERIVGDGVHPESWDADLYPDRM